MNQLWELSMLLFLVCGRFYLFCMVAKEIYDDHFFTLSIGSNEGKKEHLFSIGLVC